MGAGASIDDNAEYVEQARTEMGLEEDCEGGESCAKYLALVSTAIKAAEGSEYSPKFPCDQKKMTGEAKALGIHRWKVAGYLNGAALLGKHMAKVYGFFQACGPVQTPKHGLQITRKSLTEKLTKAGMDSKKVPAVVNSLMAVIGKERSQSGLTKRKTLTSVLGNNGEDVYAGAIKALIEKEGADVSKAWCETNWVIKTPEACPGAVLVKAELDKLATVEFGINQHENRLFWFEQFMNTGEKNTLALMEKYTKWVGGEVAEDEEIAEEAEKFGE